MAVGRLGLNGGRWKGGRVGRGGLTNTDPTGGRWVPKMEKMGGR